MKSLYSAIIATACLFSGYLPLCGMEVDDIFASKYQTKSVSGIRPSTDGVHYTCLSPDRTCIVRYAYATGLPVDTLLDIRRVPDTPMKRISGYSLGDDEKCMLVFTDAEMIYRRSYKAKYYVTRTGSHVLQPLSTRFPKQQIAALSPDGTRVAFVYENNIYVKNLADGTETQVTADGEKNRIRNGVTDWVYEEEFGQTSLMAWSPDSRALAFVRTDESGVPEYSMPLFRSKSGTYDRPQDVYPADAGFKYPVAGTDNSRVSLHVWKEGAGTTAVDLPVDAETYLPAVTFVPTTGEALVTALNRLQNHIRLVAVNIHDGSHRILFEDRSDAYIHEDDITSAVFYPDCFVAFSERDGYRHLYQYGYDGRLQRQLTSGAWEVTAYYGRDAKGNHYYQSDEEGALYRAVYCVDKKGKRRKLSTRKGSNAAWFNPSCTYCINVYSNASTPPVYTLEDVRRGRLVRTLEDNAGYPLSDLVGKEFFTFTTDDGVNLNGFIMKPADFDSTRRYPVVMTQYSGPGSQQVLDKWSSLDWEQALVPKGFIVACVDGRGTGARGRDFRQCTYRQLGVLEARDQIAAARYMAAQPYVDASRVAIWGWSFGGYMTLMAMSMSDGVYKAGVAIAPVTDWRFYDTVYTERYMATPQENAAGYDASSALKRAGDLSGDLLIVAGTADDNVHYPNTLRYIDELVAADKQFEMQIYTDRNHSIYGRNARPHLYKRFIRFFLQHLSDADE